MRRSETEIFLNKINKKDNLFGKNYKVFLSGDWKINYITGDIKYLYCCFDNKKINIYEINNNNLYKELFQKSSVLKVLSNNNYLFSTNSEYKIIIYDIINDFLVFKIINNFLLIIDIHLDDDYLYVISEINYMFIYDYNHKLEIVGSFKDHTKAIKCITSDKNYIITGSEDKNIIIYEKINEINIFEILKNHKKSVILLKLDEEYLYSGSKDSYIIIYKKNNFIITNKIKLNNHLCKSISSDEFFIYIGLDCGKLIIYLKNNKFIKIKSIKNHKKSLSAIYSNDNYLFTASDDNTILWYEKIDYFYLCNLIQYKNYKITSIYIDSFYIYVGFNNKEIKVYHKKYNFLLKTTLKLNIIVIKLTSNKNYLVACSIENDIFIYNKAMNFNKIKEISIFSNKILKIISFNDCLYVLTNKLYIFNYINYFKTEKLFKFNYIPIDFFIDINYLYVLSEEKILKIYNFQFEIKYSLNYNFEFDLIFIDKNYLFSLNKNYSISIFSKTNEFNLVNKIQNSKKVQDIFSNNIYFYLLIDSKCINIFEINHNFNLIKIIQNDNIKISKILLDDKNIYFNSNNNYIYTYKQVWENNNHEISKFNYIINDFLVEIFKNISNNHSDNSEIENLIDNIYYIYFKKWSQFEFEIYIFIIINWPMIIIFINNGILMKYFLKKFGYNKYLYSFNKDSDPFLYCIKSKNKFFWKIFINYFNEKNIIIDMNYDILFKLLNLKEDREIGKFLRNNFLKKGIFLRYLEKPKLMSIKYDFNFINSNNKYINKHILNYFEKEHYDPSFVEFYTTSFKIYKDIGNEFSFELIKKISNLETEIKLSNIKWIILYFWNNLGFIKYLFFTIFMILTLSSCLKIIWFPQNNILFIIINFTLSILLFFEIISFLNLKANYFKEKGNLMDLLIIIYNFWINIFFMYNFNENFYFDLFGYLLIYLNGLRFLIHLTIFSIIRKQISLFFKIFIKTKNFILMLIIIICYLSFINSDSYDKEYGYSLIRVYNMMLGVWDDNFKENYNYKKYTDLIINTTIFNIILLNLFISIIAEVYKEFNDNQDLYDIEEIIYYLIDISRIKMAINNIYSKFFKIKFKKYYLQICINKKNNPKDIKFILKKYHDENKISIMNINESIYQNKKEYNDKFNILKNNFDEKINYMENNINNYNITSSNKWSKLQRNFSKLSKKFTKKNTQLNKRISCLQETIQEIRQDINDNKTEVKNLNNNFKSINKLLNKINNKLTIQKFKKKKINLNNTII